MPSSRRFGWEAHVCIPLIEHFKLNWKCLERRFFGTVPVLFGRCLPNSYLFIHQIATSVHCLFGRHFWWPQVGCGCEGSRGHHQEGPVWLWSAVTFQGISDLKMICCKMLLYTVYPMPPHTIHFFGATYIGIWILLVHLLRFATGKTNRLIYR